jgi:uncharacterized protein YfaS (alpha-2-macroglobulin family)
MEGLQMVPLLLSVFLQVSGASSPPEKKASPMEAPLLAIQKEVQAAQKKNDPMAWALAIEKGAGYLQSRRKHEEAVSWFAREAWPQEDIAFALTAISYFKALQAYRWRFSWEISKRQAVEGWEKRPIRFWTEEQITQVQNNTLGKAWKKRAQLGFADVTKLKGFSKLKDFRKRDFFKKTSEKDKSLRGELSLLWADFLREQAGYSSVRDRLKKEDWLDEEDEEEDDEGEEDDEEKGEDWKPFSDELVFLKTKGDPANAKAHSLVRAAWVYADLYEWHRQNGRAEEAAEALRFHLLGLHFVDIEKRYAALETQLPLVKGKPEWAHVQAQLARWLLHKPVERHAVLQACIQADLPGPGTRWCQRQHYMLVRAELSVDARLHNVPGKTVLKVNVRNAPKLHFRAHPIAYFPDVVSKFGNTHSMYSAYERRSGQNETAPSKQNPLSPLETWSMELPQKGDFRAQELETIPKLPGKGVYELWVSTKDTFADADEDAVLKILLIQTELFLVVREMEEEFEVLVANALTGAPEAGVEVRMEEKRKGAPSMFHLLGRTNSEGKTSLRKKEGSFVFWASRGADIAVVNLRQRGGHSRDTSKERDRVLVSLDRALYRPGQPLFYKAVLLRPQNADFVPVAKQKLEVSLRDTNGREVAHQSVETNAFGSISGELKIPEEGLLGWWQLKVSDSKGQYVGFASLSVEEYKRPTFEARFLEKQEAMKLNAPVKLVGEAKYYFGQALSQGKLKWKVERVPRWLGWWWRPQPSPQTIAEGEGVVGADGRFEVAFVAKADPTLKGDVAYHYEVTGGVLDEGGETQALSYSFHLGTRALEPVFQPEGAPFFAAGKRIRLPLFNKNLDGVGQKGQGTWKLFALNPQTKRDMGESSTDRENVDWEEGVDLDWQEELQLWGEGKIQKQGEVFLDEEGKGAVDLGLVPRGAFRVVFETRDAFGNACQAEQELLVVDSRLGMPFEVWAQLEKEEVKVGEELKLFLGSQHEGQAFYVELFRKNERIAAQWIRAGDVIQAFKWRVKEEDRGGLSIRVLSIRNLAAHSFSKNVTVPWDNKALALSFSSFRDKLRPGEKERFVLSVNHKGKAVGKGEAEVLGLMYDRSLDALRPHVVPSVWELYQQRWKPFSPEESLSLREPYVGIVTRSEQEMKYKRVPYGRASYEVAALSEAAEPLMLASRTRETNDKADSPSQPAAPLRQNFAETAFFLPSLTTDERGQVSMHFEVPDSLTSWKVLASAHNKLGQGSPVLVQETKTAKELMVRPYLPRFLREGDEATWAVVVNNMSEKAMSGELVVELFEPETNTPLGPRFGLLRPKQSFHAPAQGLVKLEFALKVPMGVGAVVVKAVAKAGAYSDGEQRLLRILPSRMHLAQSRFVALKGREKKALLFEDMSKTDDATRMDERLVISIDGQLLTGVLEALPYLANYPYECTEQTFNRFFSAGMVASVFGQTPQLSSLAEQLSKKRTTRFERFDEADANRKLALEETPFFRHSKGGGVPEWMEAINLLEPEVAQKQASLALAKLKRAQSGDGGFPWFAGGRSSVYMTSYMLIGFARAKEFGVAIPEEMVRRAWGYLKGEVEGELQKCMKEGGCVEYLVLANYAASLFEPSVTGISREKQKALLVHADSKRKTLAPRLRILTALTLHHLKEEKRAREWLESWMGLSHETENEGRFWAPESMSWVWYNDTLENHALSLHALTKISPNDARAKGLVQWLFLNKKLSHWRSTRGTAEVLHALVGYLKVQNLTSQTERVEVSIGAEKKAFVFEPSNLETGKQQWVLEGKAIQPQSMGRIQVAQETEGFNFASATWHYSTQRLPEKGDGDLLGIARVYFRRVHSSGGVVLISLKEGEALRLGEEVEVELTVNARAPAEYIHLRDVRAAGFEPRSTSSGWRWGKAQAYYEEVRDSAQNYFFEKLPQGEFRFSYRLVASMAGAFRLGPASIQSMYAPEFSAYSKGHILNIVP